jgi:allantoate deiminase
MLFIRCRDGISHNPAEHVDHADAEAALSVMLGFIENWEQICLIRCSLAKSTRPSAC